MRRTIHLGFISLACTAVCYNQMIWGMDYPQESDRALQHLKFYTSVVWGDELPEGPANKLPDDVWLKIISFSQFQSCLKVMGVSIKLRDLTIQSVNQIPSNYLIHATNDHLKIWSNLTTLDLRDNHKITGDFVIRLTNLKNLKLGSNKIITGDSVGQLTNLTSLNLNRNGKITGNVLSGLTKLRSLKIGSNEIITGDSVSQLISLTSLNLNYNGKIEDNVVSRLLNLRKLSLANNRKITGNALSQLPNLSHLNLDFNEIIKDDDVHWLTNLTSLRLVSNNTITNACVNRLPNLTNIITSETICRSHQANESLNTFVSHSPIKCQCSTASKIFNVQDDWSGEHQENPPLSPHLSILNLIEENHSVFSLFYNFFRQYF